MEGWRAMECIHCKGQVLEKSNFCPNCGKSPDKHIPSYDFEVARIVALHTLKKDILTWIGTSLGIVLLFSIYGAREYIKSSVDESVSKQLSSLQKNIDDATERAHESTARAKLQTEALEQTITVLQGKEANLDLSVNDLDSKKNKLVGSLIELQGEKQKLADATTDLTKKQQQLSNIVESENMTTIFAKMRQDFYRIHSITARAEIFLKHQPVGSESKIRPLDYISLIRREKGADSEILEFTGDLNPPTMIQDKNKDTLSLVKNYMLFEPFKRRFLNKSISGLSGPNLLKIGFQVTPKSLDDFSDLVEVLNSIDQIRITVLINNVEVCNEIVSHNTLLKWNPPKTISGGQPVIAFFWQPLGSDWSDAKNAYEKQFLAAGN